MALLTFAEPFRRRKWAPNFIPFDEPASRHGRLLCSCGLLELTGRAHFAPLPAALPIRH